MGKRFDSILDTIGHTPVIRINKLGPKGVNLYVKVESFNPMGSVKDRLALGVIEDAERRGELKPGQTIVEATSGNTGIGLAMVCAQKGYPLVVTMAENFSVERRKLMRFLGARVVLTPAAEKGSGMLAKAEELAKAHGWWQPRQFENPANAEIHARTTAVEILDDFADVSLDYWVTGFGTGGTLNGVSRVLKEKSPHTQIIVCEPDNSAMLASGIAQARNGDGSHSASHPLFRPHLMQGWSPDFIPQLVEQVTAASRIDGFVPIDGKDSLRCARELARQEGIFVGISAGATFSGALQVAQAAPPGSQHPVHAARYRRTLPFHTAVRRRRRRDDRGGARIIEVDAGIPIRCRTRRRHRHQWKRRMPWTKRPPARSTPCCAIRTSPSSCSRSSGASSAGRSERCSRSTASPTPRSISIRSPTSKAIAAARYVRGSQAPDRIGHLAANLHRRRLRRRLHRRVR